MNSTVKSPFFPVCPWTGCRGRLSHKRHLKKYMCVLCVLVFRPPSRRTILAKLRNICMTVRCRSADGKRHRTVMHKRAKIVPPQQRPPSGGSINVCSKTSATAPAQRTLLYSICIALEAVVFTPAVVLLRSVLFSCLFSQEKQSGKKKAHKQKLWSGSPKNLSRLS